MSAKSDVQRMRRGHAAAEARKIALMRAEGPRPEQSIAQSLSILDALAKMGLWPRPRDPVSERGVEEVRRRWVKIKRRARK